MALGFASLCRGKVELCAHGQVIFISLDAHKDICDVFNPPRFSFVFNSASELSQEPQEGGAEFTVEFLFVWC